MTTGQDAVFLGGEGDRWFRRNAAVMADATRRDAVNEAVAAEIDPARPMRILDIGSSNGWRLAALRAVAGQGSRLCGFDASAQAAQEGMRLFPGLSLKQAAVADFAFDEPFDLAIASFVLHWIERGQLLASVANIARHLKPAGRLVIADFCPPRLLRRRYHHRDDVEVFTYKQDYSRVFVASGLFREVRRTLFAYGGARVDQAEFDRLPEGDRCAAVVVERADLYRDH
jgi:SAM-dependent methyltransferase